LAARPQPSANAFVTGLSAASTSNLHTAIDTLEPPLELQRSLNAPGTGEAVSLLNPENGALCAKVAPNLTEDLANTNS